MACTCAPIINAEMKDWINLGGANSGCCGNSAHVYGFHRAANEIPVTDYSRRRDPGQPVNMSYATAGDFHHGFKPELMARHASVLSRLMNGELPMICEMITKPWSDKPVYYWARWNGVKTLQRYTGSGHDHWSHISWWRSRVNERAYLWTPGPAKKPAAVVTPGTVAPKYPGYVLSPSAKYDANVKVFQYQLRAKGSAIATDGYFGPVTSAAVTKLQKSLRLAVDGLVGPKTWQAAWAR
jgi:hypothetical protein